jgi:hypothetical protein
VTVGTRTEPPSEGEVLRFLDQMLDEFSVFHGETAIERDLLFGAGSAGEVRVRLTMTPELAPLLEGAFAGLRSEPDTRPDLRLYALSGGSPPRPPWRAPDYLPREQIRGSTSGRVRASFSVEQRILNLLDRERKTGVFWCADPADLEAWELGAPLRHLLNWGMPDHGWRLIHGGVVGGKSGAALLAGRGGSGKSTSTIACLRAGMRTVGDDYCLLGHHDGELRAHLLYDVVKLAPDSMARFPELSDHTTPGIERTDLKAHVTLGSAFPKASTEHLEVRVLVLPHVGARTGAPRPTDAAEALRALATSTLVQLPSSGEDALRALGGLIAPLPAYRLEVGEDIEAIPPAIAELLRRHAER